ncbi:NAD-dependent epimerase/dehydratase family protein [Streptomyces sp. NPDC006602]|uniref:NAD-dependent epimerase/dehydratase family protein n=1 Tax=Streptomyces sp. NPDC006602 TaxID=3364751 RepID=UPI0036800268
MRVVVSGGSGFIERTVRKLAEPGLPTTGSDSGLRCLALPVDEPVRRRPVIFRAHQGLGRHPRVPPEDGLPHTVDWFLSQPDTLVRPREQSAVGRPPWKHSYWAAERALRSARSPDFMTATGILVTGGAGFIGSRHVRALLGRDGPPRVAVTGLDTTDIPAPRTAFGRTKFAGERAVLRMIGREAVQDVLHVVDDQYGKPWTGDVAHRLVLLGKLAPGSAPHEGHVHPGPSYPGRAAMCTTAWFRS